MDEDPKIFADVLGRVLEQRPDEVFVVINGPRNLSLEEVCHQFTERIRWQWTPVADKKGKNAFAR